MSWTVHGRDFYHCGVDRLDTWLSAQRGWRRDLLLWLYIGPLVIMLCAMAWSWTGQAGWVAIPIVLGIGGWLSIRRPEEIRRRTPRKKWRPPDLSWRRTLAALLLSACQAVNAYIGPDETTARWRHWHPAFGTVNLVASAAFTILVIAAFRYVRRMSRQAAVQAQG